MRKPKNWTLKEINYLKRNYGKTSAEKLGKKMGRSGKGIISKAFDLGLSSNYKWDRNGKNNPFWKKHHSKKSKVKMSLSKKEKTYEEIYGRKSGKDKKQNMSKSMKEKWKEKEYKNKIIRLRILSWKDNLQRRKESSIKMNKLWKNPIYRKKFLKHKIVSGMKGRHHNKKTIKKISEGNKGKIVSKETKLKISIANKGRIFSKKAKLRMSKAHKGRLKGKKNPMKKIENLRKCMLSNQIKPNLPEKQLMQIIKLNRLPFNYTGDGKIMIGGFNPDFLSKNPKHIIEIYGEYHHNLPHNKLKNIVRKRAYNSLGYKLLVIWSKKIIKNPQKVTEKIVNFYVN